MRVVVPSGDDAVDGTFAKRIEVFEAVVSDGRLEEGAEDPGVVVVSLLSKIGVGTRDT